MNTVERFYLDTKTMMFHDYEKENDPFAVERRHEVARRLLENALDRLAKKLSE